MYEVFLTRAAASWFFVVLDVPRLFSRSKGSERVEQSVRILTRCLIHNDRHVAPATQQIARTVSICFFRHMFSTFYLFGCLFPFFWFFKFIWADGAYIQTSFVLYLHCPFNWQWQTWVTSLYYQPGFYKKIYSCFTLLVHHVISFVWEWDELDNLQLQEFFGGGTFLEARVTYGGVDSGAICKEPVQAMVSHHHPQSSSWKTELHIRRIILQR